MPTISVIIPTYNGERYVKQAVDSVLAQTCRDFEIIVVDDGSTDGTAELLRPYGDRIAYVYQENRKLPAARNAGIRVARGQYLAFLDSDDLFLPHKLTAQARCLDEWPDVGLVASGHQYVDEAGRMLQESRPWIGRPAITLESILFGGLAPVHAVLLRRDWFDRVGGFDEQFAYCEDMDLWYRLALAGCPMVWEPAVVCQYRLHGNNMSRSPETHFAYLRRALEKVFADSRTPYDILLRKSELLARIDLVESSRLLSEGRDEEARQRLERAVILDTNLLAANGCVLSETLVGLQEDVFGDNRFIGFAVEVLRKKAPHLSQSISLVLAKKHFYKANEQRSPQEIQKAWINVARRDWGWMLNRGAWSILGRSLFGMKNRYLI
jgi:glycosyltransferase involved in cell wall biosynthesis